jgi:hypothetical protein
MTLTYTLIVLALAAGIFALGVWRDSRPHEPGHPTLFSWKPVYMLALVVGILMLVHLANMFGIETGKGRGRF